MDSKGAAYGVGTDALNALSSLIAQIEQLQTDVANDAIMLRAIYDENSSGLGYHSGEILSLLEALASETEGNKSVKTLVSRLKLTYRIRQDHVANETPPAQSAKQE